MPNPESYFGQNSIKPTFGPDSAAPGSKTSATPTSRTSVNPDLLDPRAPSTLLRNAENSAEKSSPSSYYITDSSKSQAKTAQNPKNRSNSAQNPLETAESHPTLYSPAAPKPQKSRQKLSKNPLLALLIGLIFGGGLLAFGSFGFLTQSLLENFNLHTNTQHLVLRKLATSKLKNMAEGKTTMPAKTQKLLAKNNIKIGVVDASGNFTEKAPVKGESRVFHFNGEVISPADFNSKLNSDVNFRQAIFKTTRGRAAGFYDASAMRTFKNKLGATRDVFRNYTNTGNTEADNTSYKNLMNDHFNATADARINTAEDHTTTNEDGTESTSRAVNGEDAATASTPGADKTAKAQNFISSVSGKVASSAGPVCATLEAGRVISQAVTAAEIYNSMKFALFFSEASDKTKYGNGSSSAQNQVNNFFTTSATSEVTDVDTGQTLKVTGTPTEASGIRKILGGNVTKSSAKNYSLERTNKTTLSSLTNSGESVTSCNVARSATAVISLATSAIPVFGVPKAIIGLLLDTSVAIGVQLAITGALSVLIPTIAEAMFANLATDAVGIAGGELFAKGLTETNFQVAQTANGAMPASAERALAFASPNNQLIAQEAEIDRLEKSPLDPTSPSTFLGSLALKLSTLSSSSSLLTNLSTLTSLATRVNAEGENSSYLTTFGDCDTTAGNIGAVGDLYCNTIPLPDPSTLDLAEDDPTYLAVLAPSLTTDQQGNEIIVQGSPLAKFILYGMNRSSQFGIPDANILSDCQTSLGLVGDNLPVISDILDIVNSAESEACMPYATGEIFVNSAENPYWDSEMKYYQYYVESHRVDEMLGLYDDDTPNPVVAFTDKYYAENPLDNSDAGYLARIAGITKPQAEATLAYYHSLTSDDSISSTNSTPDKSVSAHNSTPPSINSSISNFSTDFPDFSTKNHIFSTNFTQFSTFFPPFSPTFSTFFRPFSTIFSHFSTTILSARKSPETLA